MSAQVVEALCGHGDYMGALNAAKVAEDAHRHDPCALDMHPAGAGLAHFLTRAQEQGRELGGGSLAAFERAEVGECLVAVAGLLPRGEIPVFRSRVVGGDGGDQHVG